MFRQRRPEKIDFVIAGAQKSGTTALHALLSAHPQLAFPQKQELHFFDTDELFVRDIDYAQLLNVDVRFTREKNKKRSMREC